jgi:dolichol-phosphate mannosyltransferase
MNQRKKISIVIPAYNEGKNILAVYRQVKAIIPRQYMYEIIFIDDGSTDLSLEFMQAIHARDPLVRYISYAKNAGHQYALYSGYAAAQGDCIISIDADLQHPPKLIPVLIKSWESGNLIVHTLNKKKTRSPFSLLAGYIWHKMKVPVKLGTSDFRLIDGSLLKKVLRQPGAKKFLRGVIARIHAAQTTIEYISSRRLHGKPKYTLWKRMILFANGLLYISRLRAKK